MKKLKKRKTSLVTDYEYWQDKMDAGCYPYAMKIPINKFCLVGEFIGNPCTGKTSDEELIKTLKEESEEIFGYKLEESTLDTDLKENQFKVILTRDIHSGYYHFYRQNADGILSDKVPSCLPMLAKKQEELQSPQVWIFEVTNSRESI